VDRLWRGAVMLKMLRVGFENTGAVFHTRMHLIRFELAWRCRAKTRGILLD
jgi:hypothetical protein